MKDIKLAFVDFDGWNGKFDPDNFILTKIIRQKYNVKIVEENPDFVFCSAFHFKVLNYDCPRIYFTGECLFPDFNIYDYALGFNIFSYQDRYLRFPLWLWYEKSVELAKKKHLLSDNEILRKKKFCNFIVSNADGAVERKMLFEALNSYKRCDSAGKYLNNTGSCCADKLEFQKNYKFSAAFENYTYDGYVTEKIIEAFAAGTIPIYWGTEYICKEFNPKAFINYNDFSSPNDLVEYVKAIDSDDEAYLRMMHEPVFSDDSNAYKNFTSDNYNKVLDFFTNIFENHFGVIRRNTGSAGRKYDNFVRHAVSYESMTNKWIFPCNAFLEKKRVVIIGAGKIGQSFVKQIELISNCVLVAWLDNDTQINNQRVNAVSCIKELKYDFVIIAVKKRNAVETIKKQLINLSVTVNKMIWCEPVSLPELLRSV